MKNVILSIVILLLLIAGCIVEYWNDKKNNETLLSTFDAAWLIATTAAILLALAIIVPKAYGHDHEHPELNDWYAGLHSSNGSLCCDGSEAVHLADPEWETQNKPNSHYRVYLNKEWMDVPDSAVVTVPNKDGRALVWPYNGYMGTNIRCFMPGTMS